MGVFLKYRNYETLIEVVKILRIEGVNVRLDIIGKTNDVVYTNMICKMINDYKLENHIKVWGQVDDARYNELFNNASAFAFINIDQSWGLAVFEAMSAGLPTIVSESVGAVELLHNDIDSVIVNPKDAKAICKIIKKLMRDSTYYNRLSENAYNVVRNYSWDQLYCEPMLKLFFELKGR